MIERIPGGRRTVQTFLASLALFTIVIALLAVQMARGQDPALGDGKRAALRQRHAAAPQPQTVPYGYEQDGYGEGGYDDDGYEGGYGYQGGGYQGGYDQGYSQPQPQQQAPLQSSTS